MANNSVSVSTLAAACVTTAAASYLLFSCGVSLSKNRFIESSSDSNRDSGSSSSKHRKYRMESKDGNEFGTGDYTARRSLQAKVLHYSHSHLSGEMNDENDNDSDMTADANEYHEQLLKMEARAEERAAEVKETKKKMEVLLYMQEAVVNVNDTERVLEIIVSVAYSLVDAQRISVLVLSDDRKTLSVFESKDAKGIHVDASQGIAGYVANSGEKVNVDDCYNDPRFNSAVDKETSFRTQSILCVPIVSAGSIVGVIQAVNKKSPLNSNLLSKFTKDDERGLEALSLSAGSAIRKAQLFAAATRSNRKSQAILSVVRTRTNGASIPDLINTVTESTYHLLMAERVSVYLVDRVKGEIWICVSKDPGVAGLTLPIGKGIAGTVAETGTTINIRNCYDDDRFDNSCDKKTGFVTRSMLCMAVPGFDDVSQPVAVIQAINKIGDRCFDEDDEEALGAFCSEVKMAMRGNFLEAALLKLESDAKNATKKAHEREVDTIDSSSFLMEFFGKKSDGEVGIGLAMSPTNIRKGVRQSSWTAGGRKNSIVWTGNGSLLDGSAEYNDWGLDIFSKTTDELCSICLNFFRELNLIERLVIEEEALQNLIVSIRDTYNDVPFHNFYHGFSVCHITYLMLRNGHCSHCLRSVDMFAALVAALGHDADHPGNSNSYEVMSLSERALIHNDDAVLERHHSRTIAEIMKLEVNNVLKNFEESDKAYVRKVIIKGILGTDMSKHMDHVTALIDRGEKMTKEEGASAFSRELDSDRIELVSHLIHCSDLSGQTLPPHISQEFENRVIQEFGNQAALERSSGMKVTTYMDGLDDERKRIELQLNFISTLVLPLWRGMSKCFPVLVERVKRATDIEKDYTNRLKEMRCV